MCHHLVPVVCHSLLHAMRCNLGGFPAIRHNEKRDLTASLLSEVCHNVAIEPHLQPQNNEGLSTQICQNSRLNVHARGFWNRGQDAYFDVRVFHPNAPSYRSMDHRHELEKKQQYSQWVKEVEHGFYSPLVFSTTGGMARECSTFYRRLADMISIKQDKPYSLVVSWLRTRLSYASLRAAYLCIHGSRSSHHHPIYEHDLATAEGKIPSLV